MNAIEEMAARLKEMERRIRDLERREYSTGGATDHGTLAGLADDDHSQYHNDTRGDARYAPLAKGVTNGDTHDHAGGDGAQIDHTGLSNLNTANYTHLTAANHTDLTDGGATTLHKHAVFVPVTVTDLTDSVGNTWSGAARNTGDYTFRPADNSNLWPATATAVVLLISGSWAAAGTALINGRRSSGGTNELQVRALVAGVGYSVQGIVTLDASGYFYINVATANTASAVVRLLGYII